MSYWVYILASKPRGTLYVGVTDDLVRRTAEHREGLVPGFTKTYGVKMLVHFEEHANVLEAIRREKRVKRWARVEDRAHPGEEPGVAGFVRRDRLMAELWRRGMGPGSSFACPG